ncbi:MAG TPA: AraC family transcriptional regulator [Conexibacter sp.]|jgi:AraC-like DNA-binding protein
MSDRPEVIVDPTLDVFALLHVKHALPARLHAGGDWAIAFTGSSHVKFGAILAGSCWMALGHERGNPGIELHAGDGYLVVGPTPYVLASDLSLPHVPGAEVFANSPDRVAHYGSPDEAVILGGEVIFDERNAELLLDALPPFVLMRADDPQAPRAGAVVRTAIELLADEAAGAGLGSELMTERLADLLLLQALRVVAGRGGAEAERGWLRGLGDPEIGAALRLMHGDVARRWTVAELGAAVGMSRSSFAQRFRELVGVPPLDYLLRWRMRAAAEALAHQGATITAVALDAGYTSDSAFSNAFKRVMGVAPSHHRRDAPVAVSARVPASHLDSTRRSA